MERFINYIEKQNYNSPEIPKYEKKDPNGSKLREEAKNAGALQLLIPIDYLQGTQIASEYSSNKGKRAEKAVKKNGLSYLLKYPIIATAVYKNNEMNILVEDGHHRAYKSPRHGVPEIPTLLLTVEQMSIVRKNLKRKPDEPDEIALQLLRESFAAKESLEMRGVRKFGQGINGITNINELTRIFTSF